MSWSRAARIPGQVRDLSGVGNDDFDRGLKQSKFGYPELGLYRLKDPWKSATTKKFEISPLRISLRT